MNNQFNAALEGLDQEVQTIIKSCWLREKSVSECLHKVNECGYRCSLSIIIAFYEMLFEQYIEDSMI